MTATQMPSPGHQAAATHESTYEQRLQTLSEASVHQHFDA